MLLHDVLIVGAGPTGLAAAIAAKEYKLDYVLVEKGMLVNSIFGFPKHMVFFTTPELLEIGGLPLVTPYDKPTRFEALRYYRRVVDTYQLEIAFGEEVTTIDRERVGALEAEALFSIETRSDRGVRRVRHARTVLLATGYYDHPNLLGVPGEDLPHVAHYYSEAHPHYRQRVVIVGGRNSAAEVALELHRAGAHVTIVHRRAALGDSIKYWVKPDIENRIKEGAIAARFETSVLEIHPTMVLVEGPQGREELPADAVYLLTGYHPDRELLERCRIGMDPVTCVPRHDPQTLESEVPNLFLAGGVISGRETTPIFIENGRFHGEKVMALIRERLGH
jgi:thioredoxin reductase (NADPH)